MNSLLFILKPVTIISGLFLALSLLLFPPAAKASPPQISTPIDCHHVNNVLKTLKGYLNYDNLFDENDYLHSEKGNTIFFNFMSFVDPTKIYLLKKDLLEFAENFEFEITDDKELRINCAKSIDPIAALLEQRSQDAYEHVKTLTTDHFAPDKLQFSAFSFHPDFTDYSTVNAQLKVVWDKKAQLDWVLISESFNAQKNPSKILKALTQHFHALSLLYRTENLSHYYTLFLHAVYTSIDRFSNFIPLSHLVAGQRLLERLKSPDQRLYALEDSATFSREPHEPFWRTFGVHAKNNPQLVTEKLILPGDILFAVTSGKTNSFFDLFHTHYPDQISFAVATLNGKAKKKLFLLRPNDEGRFTPVISTMPLRNHGLQDYSGAHLVTLHDQQSQRTVKVAMAKPITSAYNNEEAFQNFSNFVNSVKNKDFDVLVLDLRNHSLIENAYNDYTGAAQYLSLFLPEDVPLGFVRQKALNSETQEFENVDTFLSASGEADVVTPEQHQKFLDTPLVILVSSLTREYDEWVATVLRIHRRALIVGDKNTMGKSTVAAGFLFDTEGIGHRMEPGLNFAALPIGGAFLPSYELYTHHGESLQEDDVLKSDIYIPTVLPAHFPFDITFDPELVDHLSYGEDVEVPDLKDWVPERIFAALKETSERRIAHNSVLKSYHKVKMQSQRDLMTATPSSVSLNQDKYLRLSQQPLDPKKSNDPAHFPPNPTQKLTPQKQLLLDQTFQEAVWVAADYHEILNHDSDISSYNWTLVNPDESPTAVKDKNKGGRKPSSSQGRGFH